jgi:hypothetical protein
MYTKVVATNMKKSAIMDGQIEKSDDWVSEEVSDITKWTRRYIHTTRTYNNAPKAKPIASVIFFKLMYVLTQEPSL